MNSIEDLRNNKDLILRANASVPDLWAYFDRIICLRKAKFTDIDIDGKVNEAFQNLIKIVDLIPLMVSFINIPQVVRGRPNQNFEIFKNQSQISYNSECSELIQFGRFNQKGEPLFYASLPTEAKSVDYMLSCALECCKELSAELNGLRYQDITIGGWLVKESFPTINLCFDDIHLIENPSLKLEIIKFFNICEECFSVEAYRFIKSFFGYFSDLTGKLATCDFDYFVTTALFHAIRWYYNEKESEFKFGIIYPSAMSEKRGMNIVLTRQAVDRYLSLDKVVMYRYFFVGSDGNNVVAYPVSDIVRSVNGYFNITNYIEPAK